MDIYSPTLSLPLLLVYRQISACKTLQEAKEFGLQLPLPFLPKGRKEIDHFGMMNQQRPSLCSYTNHQHVIIIIIILRSKKEKKGNETKAAE